jgi:hypothetical protein
VARRLWVSVILTGAAVLLGAGPAFAADATFAPSPVPSPTGTTSAGGLGSGAHGTGYFVLAVILVAALVFSGWRLRRDR